MAPAFSKAEYDDRLNRVRKAMAERDLELLVIGDPANINWLTGYDAWSFYTPQMMLVDMHDGPFWMGRLMDAGAANFTTYLTQSQIVAYPETLVQRPDTHPMDYLADWIRDNGHGRARIGYESDVYYLSPRAIAALQTGLPDADWYDADLLVNWVRLVKSEAEIAMMRQAARLAEIAMQTAWDGAQVGVRQCDLMADVLAAQIRGTPEFGGDMPAIHPLILAGEAASTAHPMWSDAPLKDGQTIAFELGGCRKRYNVGLARTVHLGAPNDDLLKTASAVEDGMAAVMDALKAGVIAGDVHKAWQRVLDRYGLEKKSRIGYSIGTAYAPDWGEHTLSFRPNEPTIVPENAVVHVILGMWMDDWGLELSETLHVRANDCQRLCDFPQHVHMVG
ncbi:Xaa-Pro peptidase family protein [Alphaproteobacteria bacterium]|nr:Xaa-Pro peptidase family protein [Alphaproteobacteria bacterium]